MAYNHDDQRTVPGVLQGVTAQNIGSGSEAIANSTGVQAPGNADPMDVTGRPGYMQAGEPGGNPALTLVPGGQYNTDNQIQTISAPAGTAGGGSYYPNVSGASGVQNPMVVAGWTAQVSTGDVEAELQITTTTLTAATHAVAYGPVAMAAVGGSGSYTWSAVNLPGGMTLSAGGSLGGTPAAAGAAAILFKVTDTHGNNADRVVNLTIN